MSLSQLKSTAARMIRNDEGNVMMIMALSLIPVLAVAGSAVDYGRAASAQAQLNAIADSAVLQVQSPGELAKPTATALTDATNFFNAQAATVKGITYNTANTLVTVADDNGTTTTTVSNDPSVTTGTTNDPANTPSHFGRTVTIKFATSSPNYFMGIVGNNAIAINGIAGSGVSKAPNIDFYLLLDTSPSMAFPTTQSGITYLQTATKDYNTCAFACHNNVANQYNNQVYDNSFSTLVKTNPHVIQVNTNGYLHDVTQIDTLGSYVEDKQYMQKNGVIYTTTNTSCTGYYHPVCTTTTTNVPNPLYNAPGTTSNSGPLVFNADNTYADTYWLTQNQGIALRVDAERTATANLMSVAQAAAAKNGATYRAALYTFDYAQNVQALSTITTSTTSASLNNVSAQSANIKLLEMYTTGGCPQPTFCNGYLETSYKGALSAMQSALPSNPGNGTNNPGDTPQQILFIITDGISDEQSSLVGAPNSTQTGGDNEDRTRSPMVQYHLNQCNAIKAAGTRIAILYTQYLPSAITSDGTQGAYVTGFLSPTDQAAAQLTKCASPGLMYTVTTGQDISTALAALFNQAVSQPVLIK